MEKPAIRTRLTDCCEAIPVEFRPVCVRIETDDIKTAGRTEFTEQPDSPIRLASAIDPEQSRSLCLAALDLSSESGFYTIRSGDSEG